MSLRDPEKALFRVAGATNLKEKIEAIVRNLASRGTGRPRRSEGQARPNTAWMKMP
jgi:hypothetical protein